jgi:hypothetical protein
VGQIDVDDAQDAKVLDDVQDGGGDAQTGG